MTTAQTIAQTIADLKAAMHKAEMDLARLPASAWVILWGNSALKTDGARVGLLGPKVYSGAQAFMQEEAARFERKLSDMVDPQPVRAMSSTDALATVQAANQELLAGLPAAVAA